MFSGVGMRPRFRLRVSPLEPRGFGVLSIKVVVHEAEEGGYWAEVPAIPGCAAQGDTMEELLGNLREAIEGCLSGMAAVASFR
jgi:predicted RNase H-like HicB family nuclease